MNELQEPRITNKPDWLELPEEEKQSHTYWRCLGETINKNESKGRYISVFSSKEEAETHASGPSDNWIWDREQATPVSLKEVMFNARRRGMKGVRVKGYKNGEWITLKIYPVEVPLI